ncbi:MAG: hypothetical protein FWD43_01370 [Coriobacteriia bacterium]|nr:hypothetical protein [Coriobacteriia bacterium]
MADETKIEIQEPVVSATSKKKRSGRGFRTLNNLITFVSAAVIIAGGYMLPTVMYPYLDFYKNDMIQLTEPEKEYVLENPNGSYPWDYYAEELLHPLTTYQREFLYSNNIPSFILSSMCNYGLKMDKSPTAYYRDIIDSFNYLDLSDVDGTACYVLVDYDIDGDRVPDLRCAVSLEGIAISFHTLSPVWYDISVESPIGLPTTPEIVEPGIDDPPVEPEENEDGLAGYSSQEGDGTPGDGTTGDETTGDGTTGDGTTGDGTTGDGTTGDGTTGDGTTGEGQGNTTGANGENGSTPNPAGVTVDRPPVEEDKNIWSFAYVFSREALLINQQTLFTVFRQLELYYETRYGYSYIQLLPIQSPEDEVLPEVEQMAPSPMIIDSGSYKLYIYNLPTGEQLILYLESATLKCSGFDLLVSKS